MTESLDPSSETVVVVRSNVIRSCFSGRKPTSTVLVTGLVGKTVRLQFMAKVVMLQLLLNRLF